MSWWYWFLNLCRTNLFNNMGGGGLVFNLLYCQPLELFDTLFHWLGTWVWWQTYMDWLFNLLRRCWFTFCNRCFLLYRGSLHSRFILLLLNFRLGLSGWGSSENSSHWLLKLLIWHLEGLLWPSKLSQDDLFFVRCILLKLRLRLIAIKSRECLQLGRI
jgi:hypothetical protein